MGYELDLYNCSLCQRKLRPEKLYFSIKEGGIIDSSCFLKVNKGEAISPETIKILRMMLKDKWSILEKIKLNESYLKQLDLISNNYISYYRRRK